MSNLLHESDFSLENYEGFYENHYFQPLPDDKALNAHRIIPRVDWALDVANVHQPKSVLDLGCLDGFAGLTIANNERSVKRLVGVDLSKDGIDLATQRKRGFRASIDFYQEKIEDFLTRTDEKFDLIMLFEVIEHVVNPKKLLKLIDGAKTKNGLVLISTPSFEAPTFGKNDVKNKCHIRLYTTKEKDYEEMTDVPDPDTGKCYMRTATSLPKEIGKHRIISIGVYSELINCIYS
jgi:2-polyprenyl-3-methyl-5-hydroxy-6-metoxy-1,4-benzoquinol methylase